MGLRYSRRRSANNRIVVFSLPIPKSLTEFCSPNVPQRHTRRLPLCVIGIFRSRPRILSRHGTADTFVAGRSVHDIRQIRRVVKPQSVAEFMGEYTRPKCGISGSRLFLDCQQVVKIMGPLSVRCLFYRSSCVFIQCLLYQVVGLKFPGDRRICDLVDIACLTQMGTVEIDYLACN